MKITELPTWGSAGATGPADYRNIDTAAIHCGYDAIPGRRVLGSAVSYRELSLLILHSDNTATAFVLKLNDAATIPRR